MNSELVTNLPDNCDEFFAMYDQTLKSLLDDSAPLIQFAGNRRRRRAPWYTAQCRDIKAKTRRLEKIYRRKRTEEAEIAWRRQFTLQRTVFQQMYAEYWSTAVRESTDSKSLWRRMSSLLHPSSQFVNPFSPSDIASYFISKIESIRQSTDAASRPTILARATVALDNFDPVTVQEVQKLLATVSAKQCALDPVPTWLIKQCANVLAPVITSMANMSLSAAVFPSNQKHAIIKPILKKPDLDVCDLKSYRPVSNLSFISKFLERLVLRRLFSHCDDNRLLPKYQSGYRPQHSTETALVCVVNHVLHSIDDGEVCALVLLDLSAAFDTVDHQHLLDVMHDRFGIHGPVHDWFASYISGRSQTVTVNSVCSLPARLVCGVPQGSVLGPVKFIVYTEELASVIDNVPAVLPHFYADDTQLLMSTRPDGVTAVCRVLEQCVCDVQTWCSSRRLQLNPAKTELIWFGSQVNMERLATSDISVHVGQTVIEPSDRVRDLGVILDSSMSMRQHIAKVTSTCFFHLRRLRKIGKVLDQDNRNRLVCAFILTRIDYCNSLFAGLPDSALAPLQRVLHAAARFVGGLQPRDHVTATMMKLHWLPVRQRITYKLCCLMHGVVHGHAPEYVVDMVVPVSHLPGRSHLRSAQRGHFDIPRSRTAFGSRSFSTAAPLAWNELPADIRDITTTVTFKKHLKTLLFNVAYGPAFL